MAPARATKTSPLPSAGTRLRDQVELYRKIFANSVDGIAIVDPQGYYLEQNAAHAELTGYSDAELAGKTPAVHLDAPTLNRIMAALRTSGTFRGEVLSHHRSGAVRKIDLAAFAVLSERGEPVCYVGIKRDISERERMEQERAARIRELETFYALAQALNRAIRVEDMYASALDALELATGADCASILLFDEAGVMRFKAWRNLSDGYRQAVEGHTPWTRDAVNPAPVTVEDVETCSDLAAYREAFRREQIGALAFIPICYEGNLLGKFMVYFRQPHSFSPIEIRMAEVIAAHIGVAIHRHHTEQALRRSEKLAAAGRLAATVAHEINNPLEAVTNFLFLARHESSTRKIREYLERAESELQRVSSIAKQTLAFYRDSSAPGRVQLAAVLDSTVALYRPKAQERGIRLQTECDGVLEVFGSAGELRQLFANLIVNALDATPAGGDVQIRATNSGDMVTIQIADTGCGIPPEHLAHIFEPFFTTKQHVGTGLGLWLAREVAIKHNGSIELTSSTDPESHGTCVRVRLPASRS